MFNLFGLDKVALQIIGVILSTLLVVGIYYWWKWGIEKDAMNKWNKMQVELVQKENQKTVETLKQINEDKQKEIRQLELRNVTLEKKLQNLKSYVDSPEAKKKYKDIPSSEILKRTIRELGL